MTAGSSLVVDSHAFIWYVQASPRLSDKARQAMDEATSADVPLMISAATLVELVYLVEKGRPAGDLRQSASPARRPGNHLVSVPCWAHGEVSTGVSAGPGFHRYRLAVHVTLRPASYCASDIATTNSIYPIPRTRTATTASAALAGVACPAGTGVMPGDS